MTAMKLNESLGLKGRNKQLCGHRQGHKLFGETHPRTGDVPEARRAFKMRGQRICTAMTREIRREAPSLVAFDYSMCDGADGATRRIGPPSLRKPRLGRSSRAAVNRLLTGCLRWYLVELVRTTRRNSLDFSQATSGWKSSSSMSSSIG